MSHEIRNSNEKSPHLVAIAYKASLVFIPWIWALSMPVLLLAASYRGATNNRPLHALTDSMSWAIRLLNHSGPIAIVYIVVGNLLAVGCLIVVCWALSHCWNAKRVYFMMCIGLLIPSTVAWTSDYSVIVRDVRRAVPMAEAYAKHFPDNSETRMHRQGMLFASRGSWDHFVWSYHPLALLGIPIGALIAMHPILKPGPRYYLRRSQCPKCEYDLRGRIDDGCPECGWNRPAASFDEMAERNGEG